MTTRRAFLTSALTAVAGTALASCSRDVPQTPHVEVANWRYPVLDSDRLATILSRIGSGLSDADAQKNADALASILTGPAARIRAGEYALATALGENSLIRTFSTTSQAGAVGYTTDFPRTAIVITEPTADTEPPFFLTLTQESARENVRLWSWARLFAGVEIPSTFTPDAGSEQVDATSTGLVATPQEVCDAYIALLNTPNGDNPYGFGDDIVRQRLASERAVDLSGMGTVSVAATAGTDGIKGLRTAEDGALVSTSFTFTTVYAKTTANATLHVGGNVGALLGGDTEVRGTVTATYDVMMTFSIPSKKAGGSVVALGSDLVLVSTSRDDAAAPQG